MPIHIKMPKLSDTMVEGILASWKKKPGEAVQSGDILGEVETDKAVMPIENFEEGVLAKQVVVEGETVPVGAVIAVIATSGEDWQVVAKQEVTSAPPTPKAPPPSAKPSAAAHTAAVRVKASPLAKKMAAQEGVDLSVVPGSGPGGRITQKDLQKALETRKSSPSTGAPAVFAPLADIVTNVSGVRATIAKRLLESKTGIPHFYAEVDIFADKLTAARAALKAALPDEKITVNDFILRACALALRKHPVVNSSWREGKIVQHGAVNVGMGIAVEAGLLVAVLRDADRLTLRQVAGESRQLTAAARARTLTPAQMTGGTFTISNMGMLGITRFTAIINPPEAAILAVGTIRDEPVVRNDQVVPGQRMSLTLSADHRVVDGSDAAAFLHTLRTLLEEPLLTLV